MAHPGASSRLLRARALLEALLGVAGVEWRADPEARPFLHPGRSAAVWTGDGRKLGWVGELHPLVLREWDLEGPAAAFEIDVDAIVERAQPARGLQRRHELPGGPAGHRGGRGRRRAGRRVEEAVRAAGGELLGALAVFDLYRGEQVGAGNKSLALRLEFRAADRTLTDDEVAERRTAIEQELESVGGRLRA